VIIARQELDDISQWHYWYVYIGLCLNFQAAVLVICACCLHWSVFFFWFTGNAAWYEYKRKCVCLFSYNEKHDDDEELQFASILVCWSVYSYGSY